MNESLIAVINVLNGVKRTGSSWMARCPAHEDDKASLSVSEGKSHPVALYCHAGCDFQRIVEALSGLGIDRQALFADDSPPGRNGSTSGDWTPYGDAVATYDYLDERGKLLFQVLRTADKQFPVRHRDPSKPKGWAWNLNGVRRVLYRLPQVTAAVAEGRTIWIVEGEKDVHALESAGEVATCNPGGAGKWRDEYSTWLVGADVIIVADCDEPGDRHARLVYESLTDVRSRMIVEPAHGKDAADHLGHGLSIDEFLVSCNVGDDVATVPASPELNAPAPNGSVSSETSANDCDGWDFLPITPDVLPRFPIEELGWVGEYAAAVADATQTPVDMAAMLGLGVTAASLCGRADVQVKPHWRETTNLYVLLLADPAERKSAVFAHMAGVVEEFEQDEIERTASGRKEAAAQKRIADEATKEAERRASKASDGETRRNLEAEALGAGAHAASIEVPPEPVLLMRDATSEVLAKRTAEQGGRMTIAAAEGGAVFGAMTGMYSRPGAINLDFWLSGHAGESIRVHRVGRDTDYIKSARVTIILAVQPETIRFLSDRAMRGRGLSARFCYSQPESMVGRRNSRGASAIPASLTAVYKGRMTEILKRFYPLTEPQVFELTPEAAAAIDDLEEEMDRRMAPGGDLHHMRDWCGKAHGLMARIACALHVVRSNGEAATSITGETAQGARSVVDYLLAHACAAYAAMGTTDALDSARELLRWVERKAGDGVEEFTRRDAHYENRGRFAVVSDLEPALALLEAHSYLRRVDVAPGPKGGRPSIRYAVNPRLVGSRSEWRSSPQNSHNTQNPVVGSENRGSVGSVGFEGASPSLNGGTSPPGTSGLPSRSASSVPGGTDE